MSLSPADLVSEARRHGAEFRVDSEGNVTLRKSDRLPPDLLAQLTEKRDVVRRYLRLLAADGAVEQGRLEF